LRDQEARPPMPVVFVHAKTHKQAPEYANEFEAARHCLMRLTTHMTDMPTNENTGSASAARAPQPVTNQRKHNKVVKTAENAAAVEAGYADFHLKALKKRRKASEHDPDLQEQAQIAQGVWGPIVKKRRKHKKQQEQEQQELEQVRSTRRLFMAELQEAIWGPSRYPRERTKSACTIHECDEALRTWKPENTGV